MASKGTNTTDMRLRDGVEDHLKVQKLVARFGLAGFGALVCLWRYAKEHAPADGILSGVEIEDLAIVSRISREAPEKAEEFGRALIDLRLVDRLEDGRLAVHDWKEEQDHIVEAALGYPKAKENGSKGGKQSVKTRRAKFGNAQPRSNLEPPLRDNRTPPSSDTEAASKPIRTPPSEAPKPMPSMPPSPALPKAKAGEGEEDNASLRSAPADAPPPKEAGTEKVRPAKHWTDVKQTPEDIARLRAMNPPRRPPPR